MYREPRALRRTHRILAWITGRQTGTKAGTADTAGDRSGGNEMRRVSEVARALDVSDFELFRLAYRSWYGHQPATVELERQFGRYLMQRIRAPFYVRRFLPLISRLAA